LAIEFSECLSEKTSWLRAGFDFGFNSERKFSLEERGSAYLCQQRSSAVVVGLRVGVAGSLSLLSKCHFAVYLL